MQLVEMVTIIGSILVPMIAGFGWMIHRMDKKFDSIEHRMDTIEKRLTIIETILQMLGYPIRSGTDKH